MRILLTGATGFVGSHLYPALVEAGHEVVCASRHPERARAAEPDKEWRRCDASDAESLRTALRDCDAAYYLVHSLASGAHYPEREAHAAETFRRVAAEVELERIVYLGGVAPRGVVSPHLESRLRCGAILRRGPVPVFELRAAMIIGWGSVSWQMVHDLARRLPAMVLPRWMANHSWPIAISDVVYALVAVLDLPPDRAGHYDIPGPERLSHRDVLLRVAALLGHRPPTVGVPLLTPRLSSYWIRLVSGVKPEMIGELVRGLSSDLDPSSPTLWSLLPPHERLTVEQSALRALDEEREQRASRHTPRGAARRRWHDLVAR